MATGRCPMRALVAVCLGVAGIGVFLLKTIATTVISKEYERWARPVSQALTRRANMLDPARADERWGNLMAVQGDGESGLFEACQDLLGAMRIYAVATTRHETQAAPSPSALASPLPVGDPWSLSYLQREASLATRRSNTFLVATRKGWKQTENRYTAFSAAAYMQVRDRFRRPGTEIRAIRYRGRRNDLGAIELRAQTGERLRLTGMASGHSGEGGRALGALLVDLGFFDRQELAHRWAASQRRAACWTLTVGDSPFPA